MNEKEIRKSLIAYLLKKHSRCNKIKFISELFVNNNASRVDLVMANGKLVAFEIKSELDTLRRLNKQIDDYSICFEEIYVVCAAKHKANVLNLSDNRFGILSINSKNKIEAIKCATKRSLTKEQWLSHLPVRELQTILRQQNQIARGVRIDLVNRVCNLLTEKQIRNYVINTYYKLNRPEYIDNLISEKRAKIKEGKSKFVDIQSNKMSNSVLTILPRATPKDPNPSPIRVHMH